MADPWQSEWGHDQARFSPAKYGDYIATSTDVFSCVTLRARLMSELEEPRLYRGRGPEKQEVTSGRAVDLLRRVNPFWTWPRLARMDEMCMGLWGETFWALEGDRFGEPSEIWWLKPSRVRPVPHPTRYLSGYLYHPADGSKPIPFTPDEVVWFRYPNPIDEFSPLSPVAAARLAADTSSDMMKANRNLFVNGMHVGGFVSPGNDRVAYSTEQAEELEHLLERRLKGVDKAHRWAVLRFEAQFDKADLSPKDAQWVEGLNMTLRQIANAYGIPTPLLNDMEHATLANTREYERMVWANALVPDAKFRAAEIVEQLLPKFRSQRRADNAEFDFGGIPSLQESASEAWARERQAIEVGALTINEWRKRHGMPAVDWGDVFWAPINKAPVSSGDMPPWADDDTDGPDGAEARARALSTVELMLTDQFDAFERRLAGATNGNHNS